MLKSKKSFTKISVTVLSIISIAAISLSIYNIIQINKLNKEIKKLNKFQTTLENKVNTQEFNWNDFDNKVVKSITNYVEKEQSNKIKAKYLAYSNAPDVINEHFTYGDNSARFTLMMFSEIECPYCLRFHSTPRQLVDSSNGNINLKWMHFPMPFHNPAAKNEAMVAECIAEQKGNKGFWVAIDELFNLSQGNGKGIKNINAIIQVTGANFDLFNQCMKDARYSNKIEMQINTGKELGVNGTPTTIIIDNQTQKRVTISGAQPAAAITSIISKMISESN